MFKRRTHGLAVNCTEATRLRLLMLGLFKEQRAIPILGTVRKRPKCALRHAPVAHRSRTG